MNCNHDTMSVLLLIAIKRRCDWLCLDHEFMTHNGAIASYFENVASTHCAF